MAKLAKYIVTITPRWYANYVVCIANFFLILGLAEYEHADAFVRKHAYKYKARLSNESD